MGTELWTGACTDVNCAPYLLTCAGIYMSTIFGPRWSSDNGIDDSGSPALINIVLALCGRITHLVLVRLQDALRMVLLFGAQTQ